MAGAIEGLKPPLVWKYFAELARIPRCSKNEAAVAKWVMATAGRLGLEAKQDEVLNVVVRKPASAGRDSAPSVCLQGHLDMVCEKEPSKAHDFSKDALELVRRGDTVMANGTTLGADNGIAVATNLAIMEDRSLVHGPLEFLFTIDEETGLTGAANLQPGFVTSRILLNLDSEEEGELYVGCAGGRDTTGTWTVAFDPAPAGFVPLEVRVGGLRGGHSGLEINGNRANAVKILNRLVSAAAERGARVSRINGGNKRNAIPRDAEALLFVPRAGLDAIRAAIADLAAVIRVENATVEPDFTASAEPAKGVRGGKVLKRAAQKKILQTILALPHGVIKMSPDIPGLVETSTNVAVVTTGKKAIALATSQRSSVASEIEDVAAMVRAVFELGGAAVTGSDGYPGWKPNLDSPILNLAKETYKRLYGKDPAVKAVHAGLECGIIGEKYPGIDMVSFGPTLQDVHSPQERIFVDTVPKFWNFLLALLGAVQ
jgi:dipeptidase D